MTDPVALRLGRNLRSLEYATDPANRATRLMPLMAQVGGLPTYLGFSRWLVTDNTSHVLTLDDPGGGAPPIGFDDQLNNDSGDTWYVYREKTAQVYAITDCSLSPNTVTVPSEPGIAVGEYLQFRTSATAGDPIAVGPGASIGSLARGYINPLLATGIASAVLTTVPAPTTNGQYVGDDVAFSNYVQTSVGGFSPPDGWPTFTVTITSGADTSGLAVDDWCLTGDLSWWKDLGGQAESLPPMTVTAINSASELVVTIRGQGPSFRQGLSDGVTLLFFRPVAGNLTGTITDSDASAATVTVDDATSITATGSAPCALELSYTPSIGEVPYYLDHPVYIASTDPGIGVKFGTIQRRSLVGISNLAANGYLRNWSGGTPVGWDTILVSAITGPTFEQLTDPLFTQLGGSSAKITFPTTNNSGARSEILAWRAAYPGQRFSVRVRLMFPERWSGNLMVEMRLGIQKSDGSLKTWALPDPVDRLIPPDYLNADSSWHAVPQGVWIDAVIHGFDITKSNSVSPTYVQQADLADAVGYFIAFFPVNSAGALPMIVDGYSITATAKAPDKILEFGEANVGWQETNRALGDLAPPQIQLSAAVVDVERMNPSLTPDEIRLGRRALVHVPSLGVVNVSQRMTDVVPNKLVPGDTRIVLAAHTQAFTRLLLDGQEALGDQVSTVSDAVGGGTTPGGTTPPGGGAPPPGGTILPAIQINIAVDSAIVPTATAVGNAVVTRVKLAGRTDRYPIADEVRAEASITSPPFSATYAALDPGQTLFVAGFGYDNANNESAFATAIYLASATTVPLHGLVAHYIASLGVTESGGVVTDWADQTANHYDLDDNNSSDPVKFSSVVNGEPAVRYDSNDLTWTATNVLPRPSDCTLFAVISPGATVNDMIALSIGDGVDPGLHLGAGGTNNRIGGGTAATCNESFTGTGSFDVIVARRSGTTVTYFKNSVACTPTFTVSLGTGTTYKIGIGRAVTSAPVSSWIGDVAEGGVYDVALSDAEVVALSAGLATKYDIGGSGTPSAPTFDVVYAGGDVIVTAQAPFADSVKMDGSTSGTPTDATVRATLALTAVPFSKTFPAPTGADILHVKAFAYIGATESASATVNIPAEPGTAPSDPEYLVGASSAALENERVVTNTTTVAWDLTTGGQAKANVPDGSLVVAKLDATGTPSSATFLRGDGTWDTPAGTTVHTIGAGFDGSGAALTLTGTIKVRVGPVPFSGTISLSAIVLDQSGACTIGVKSCARASYPGSLSDLTGGADITVSGAPQDEDSTLSGWTTSVTADEVFEFELKSVDGTIEQAAVLLKVS